MFFKSVLTPSIFFTAVSLLVGKAEYSMASVLSKSEWSDPGFSLYDMVYEYFPGESEDIREVLFKRFNRAGKYNKAIAKNKLYQYVEWREAENIDSVLEENCTDMDELYHYRKSIYTYPGTEYRALVLSIDLGKWDLRVAAYSTQSEQKRFVRFVTGKMMEDVNRDSFPGIVVGGRTAYPQILKYDIVINMKDHDLEKHACLQCTRLLIETIGEVGDHWGEAINSTYLANAPNFPSHVHSWIAEFRMGTGIPVEILPGQVLFSQPKGDKVDSLVVFRDWVWTIEE